MGERECYLIYREPQPLRASVEDIVVCDQSLACPSSLLVGALIV